MDVFDPAVAKQLRLAANLSEMMVALYDTAGINACYIALPEGVMLLTDDHPSSKYDENGKLITFPMTRRDWYRNRGLDDTERRQRAHRRPAHHVDANTV